MIKKVLNTVASTGGDITLSKKILTIATLLPIEFDLIKSTTGLLQPLVETRQIQEIAYTPANNTTYKFMIEQFVDGENVRKIVEYESDASGADAEIAAGLVGSFNAAKNGIKAVASGTVTPITFTADAKYNSDYDIVGEPLFKITIIENINSIADAQTAHTTALQAGSITDATPCVVTAVAHGQTTGNTVTLAGITTATTLNATWRVTVVGADNYSLDGSVEGTGAAGVGAATAVQVAQESRGYKGDLIADGVASNDISDNTAYGTLTIDYAVEVKDLMKAKRDINEYQSRLYISAHSTSGTGYTATSNYADFVTIITEKLKGTITDTMVKFVGYNHRLATPTGTWTETRVARGNYAYRKTVTDETSIVGTNITPALRTAASKGFKFVSMDIIYGATSLALDTAPTVTLDRIEYVDNTAVSVNSIAITSETFVVTARATPYVVNVAVDVPLYDVTDDSKYVVEVTFNAGATTVVDWYGIMLKFTRTQVDHEVLGNI